MGFMMVTCGRSGTPGVVRQTRRTSTREACSKFAGGNEPHALRARANPIATATEERDATAPPRTLRVRASRDRVQKTLMTDRTIWRVRRREVARVLREFAG